MDLTQKLRPRMTLTIILCQLIQAYVTAVNTTEPKIFGKMLLNVGTMAQLFKRRTQSKVPDV